LRLGLRKRLPVLYEYLLAYRIQPFLLRTCGVGSCHGRSWTKVKVYYAIRTQSATAWGDRGGRRPRSSYGLVLWSLSLAVKAWWQTSYLIPRKTRLIHEVDTGVTESLSNLYAVKLCEVRVSGRTCWHTELQPRKHSIQQI
jgi:hypothetical protein